MNDYPTNQQIADTLSPGIRGIAAVSYAIVTLFTIWALPFAILNAVEAVRQAVERADLMEP